jgi:peptidoglycan/LPS O-acetylase OafA/YrhL
VDVRDIELWEGIRMLPLWQRVMLAVVLAPAASYAVVFGLCHATGLHRGLLFDVQGFALFYVVGIGQILLAWWLDKSFWRVGLAFAIGGSALWVVVVVILARLSWHDLIFVGLIAGYCMLTALLMREYTRRAEIVTFADRRSSKRSTPYPS